MRAREPSFWERLAFSQFELRCAGLAAIVVGIYWAYEATTVLGGVARCFIGAMIGTFFGLRVADQYQDSGRFFRWSMKLFAVTGVGFALVIVVGWMV